MNGWLELKVVDDWPKRSIKTVVPVDLRPAQRVFLTARNRTGGHCGVFVWVQKQDEYFLFTKQAALYELGKTLTHEHWHGSSSVHTSDALPEPTRLLDVLTGIYRYGEL